MCVCVSLVFRNFPRYFRRNVMPDLSKKLARKFNSAYIFPEKSTINRAACVRLNASKFLPSERASGELFLIELKKFPHPHLVSKG